ncbi:MAG: acyltransferase [Zoogloeaceae bacterium]|jgi:predicted LPLAT superfamily acyltransferase|nr:acyltransferase [Zoogloeaceae bacterium]
MRESSPSRTHWAEIKEAGFVGGMRFLFWVHRYGGAWLFRALLFFVMLWFFATRPLARHASLEYLTRLHQESRGATPAPNWRNCFRHFMCFAETILDKMLAFDPRCEPPPCQISGAEHVQPLFDAGRGALMITAHLGNVELCRRLARKLVKARVTVLMHMQNAQAFNQILRALNPRMEIDILQVATFDIATAVLLSERIEAGGLVVIAGDRIPLTPDSATLALPFLGAPARFPLGPYILAAALGCPVLTLFGARGAEGFTITIRPLAERIVLPRRERQQAVAPYLSAYVAALTEECRKNPLQWFNFFPFWQAPAP